MIEQDRAGAQRVAADAQWRIDPVVVRLRLDQRCKQVACPAAIGEQLDRPLLRYLIQVQMTPVW